jgi:hypothetical protein
METRECKITDQEICDLLFNIRQTMQIVQAQFDVMNNAIDQCGRLYVHNAEECIQVLDIAHNEITRFQELNSQMVTLFSQFQTFILTRYGKFQND